MAMKRKLKIIAAALAAITAMSCVSATAFADSGEPCTAAVSASEKKGWVTEDGAEYYYKKGARVTKTWIKGKNGKYRYVDADGKMVTGWAEVKRGKEGRFSWFDENGYWDGMTYYSRYDEYEGFGNTVTVKVSRNEIISESSGCYLDNGGGSEKKAKAYVLNNTEYELEIPLAVADQLSVGDKLIISPNVKRGDKVDGKYQYKLCIHTLYSPDRGDESYRDRDSENVSVNVKEARTELFNRLLVLKNGKLKLDMMFDAYSLDRDVLGRDYSDDENEYDEWYRGEYFYRRYDKAEQKYYTTFGLFGGYNEYNEKTGKYAYRNNISEKTLKKLMKNRIAEHKAELEKNKNDDVDYYDWVGNMLDCWLDVTVTEIPELPLSASKRKFVGAPELTVTAGKVTAEAYDGTSDWENVYSDIGVCVGQCDDAVGALHSEAADHPVKMKAGEPVKLSFAYGDMPKTLTVRCWPDKYKNDYGAYEKYENVTVSDMSFTPKKGGYIYEVYASWNEFTVDGVAMSGDCYYTVYIVAG
jgi:hypothetical protein